jgi:hypothetical protein
VMSRRLGEKSRLWCYRFIALRDGDRCRSCGAFPVTRNNGNVSLVLEIDHIDGDPWNWQPDNLRLLCKKCNLAERNRASCAPRVDSAYMRKRDEGHESTRIVREVVDCDDPSAPVTVRLNARYETLARTYALQLIAEKGYRLKVEVVAGMAEVTGCSIITAARYLAKLLGPAGPLQERKDMLGGFMLEFKPEYRQAALMPEENHQAASQEVPRVRAV